MLHICLHLRSPGPESSMSPYMFSAVPHLQTWLSNRLMMTQNNMTHKQYIISFTAETVIFQIFSLSLYVNVHVAEV